MRECEQLPATLLTALKPPGSELDSRRTAMMQRARERCANLKEEDFKRLRQLGTEGIAANDIGFLAVAPISYESPAFDLERTRERQLRKVDAPTRRTMPASRNWFYAN